jgi:cell division inhibitor SepF
MGVWDKIKKSINPGEDDDNTYDDDEFEDDYSMSSGGFDSASDMSASGNFNQQNPVYTQSAPNYNNYQPPANNNQPPASSAPVSAVTSVMGGDMHASYEVKVIKPESYSDGRRIADLLMARKTVIVNFDETNKEIIRKLLDFMGGAAYMIKGDLNRVGEKTFIITPPNAKFSSEQVKNTERGDINRDSSIY